MLFARWRHHIRFGSGFPYAPFNTMLTKMSKWSRIEDSFRITPKIESLVVFAIPDMPSKFQKDPSRTFWVILLTHRQTDKQTNKLQQKHNLLGGSNKNMDKSNLAIAGSLPTELKGKTPAAIVSNQASANVFFGCAYSQQIVSKLVKSQSRDHC